MAIYGTAILSICLLCGLYAGRASGRLLGLDTDLGGVGIAMVLLIAVTGWMERHGKLKAATAAGIEFWSAVYIPVVVALAMGLNVRGAIGGGPVALLAGGLVVAVCFALVPVVARIGGGNDEEER